MAIVDNYPEVLAAVTIWREARNQPYQAMVGVAWVLRNRIDAIRDLVSVITQRFQFSSMTTPKDPNLVVWPQSNDPQFEECCAAVEGVFGGVIADPTGRATFYFSPPLIEPPVQEWGPVVVTWRVGQLTFCRSSQAT